MYSRQAMNSSLAKDGLTLNDPPVSLELQVCLTMLNLCDSGY